MGLFDFFKRKQDWEIDDEPQLRPDRQLSAATPAADDLVAKPDAGKSDVVAAEIKNPEKAEPATEVAPASTSPREEDMPDFGIQKAIELMRDLPQKESDVVVQAVCKTLASIGIEVPDIIAQAKDKQDGITGRIKNLKGEISELEEEIAGRKEEIKALEADHKETGEVRSRLEKATSKAKEPEKSVPAPVTSSASSSSSGSLGKPAKGDKGDAKLGAKPKYGNIPTPSLSPTASSSPLNSDLPGN